MSKEIDISLIVPPARASSLRPPLGLMYIASCLRENNLTPSIIDIKSKKIRLSFYPKLSTRLKKKNPEELANGIEYLLDRPELRNNITKNAKHFITKEKGYEKKIILEKYLNIYKQLISHYKS